MQLAQDLVDEMTEDERVRLLRVMVRACGIERSMSAVETARLEGDDSVTSSDCYTTDTAGEEEAERAAAPPPGDAVRIDFARGFRGDSDDRDEPGDYKRYDPEDRKEKRVLDAHWEVELHE